MCNSFEKKTEKKSSHRRVFYRIYRFNSYYPFLSY